MGELFLAERVDQRGPQNKIVLKRLLADYLEDERYVRMFRAEAKVMSSLDHPNIVKVFDVPVIDGKQCLAMEYVQGRNLAQILRRCCELNTAIPPQVALHVMIEVLHGLDYAHQFVLDDGRPLGLVHRDVTPGNILVSFDGSVKITDFGISKSEMSSVSTTVGVVKGTTRYLAPEQIRGHTATPRSDGFSAAVVLAEALSGQALFDHGTVPPTLFAIVTGQRPPIAELLPFPAPRLAAALEKMLDLHPERRYATAREFAEAIEDGARELGRLMDKSGLGTFLKELFRDSEQPNDFEEEVGPWQLDAMDLTYLFEVQELNAFKPDVATPFADRSDELQRVRALLKAAVPGANPLDAELFSRRAKKGDPDHPRDALVEGLSSPTGLRNLPRESTKLDRPKPTDPAALIPPPPPDPPLAETADVFSDPTQIGGDVVENTETDDIVEVLRIDPASLPLPRLTEPPAPKVTKAPVQPGPQRASGKLRGVAFFALGLVLGAAAWSQAWRLEPYLPPAARALVGSRMVSTAPDRPLERVRGEPPIRTYPSLQHHLATAHEGARPGARVVRTVEAKPALLTVRRPKGARIRLNGVWLEERAPLIDHPIPPGEYRIEVVKKKLRKKVHLEAQAGESIDLNRR